MASVTEEPKFKFYFSFIIINLNNHTQLLDTVLGSAGGLSPWESDNLVLVCELCHLLVV